MKKLLTLLLTLFMSLSLIVINTKDIKAEGNDPTPITQTSYDEEVNAKGYFELTGDFVLEEDITLTAPFETETVFDATLDLAGHTIKAADSYSGNMFEVDDPLTINDSSLFNTGVIDGNYVEGSIEHSGFIRGFSASGRGVLTINGGTIQNCRSKENGAAICSNAKIYLNGGTIQNCQTSLNGFDSARGNGGAIYNESNDTYINGGTIQNCKAAHGGAIFNDFGTVYMSGGVIKNCLVTGSGGAISDSNNASFVMSGGTISDCHTINEDGLDGRGGAICHSYLAGDLILTRGTIQNCSSQYGAILLLGGQLILNGDIKLDNTNDKGNKDDICFYNKDGYERKIVIKDGFNPSNQIAIWAPIDFLKDKIEVDVVEVDESYTLTKSLKDMFIAAHGQEYLTEYNDPNKLTLKAVMLTQNPQFSNKYTVTTNYTDDPINITYQWYNLPTLEEITILEPKSYKGKISKNLNFEVVTRQGEYDPVTKKWKLEGDKYETHLFDIKGLKKGQILSFVYEGDPAVVESYITIYNSEYTYHKITTIDQYEGVFTLKIPKDDDYTIEIEMYKPNYVASDVFVSNISIKQQKQVKSDTKQYLSHPVSDSYTNCVIKYENPDGGAIDYETTNDVIFGKVLKGDNQNILVNTGKEVEIIFDASNKYVEYLPLDDMRVYLDGINDEQLIGSDYYSLSDVSTNKQGIRLLLNKDYISNLDAGIHTVFIVNTNTEGKECAVATLNIIAYPPTPDPQPKDESCEKVIGPTWHWNNTKGICEEYSTVGTYTR